MPLFVRRLPLKALDLNIHKPNASVLFRIRSSSKKLLQRITTAQAVYAHCDTENKEQKFSVSILLDFLTYSERKKTSCSPLAPASKSGAQRMSHRWWNRVRNFATRVTIPVVMSPSSGAFLAIQESLEKIKWALHHLAATDGFEWNQINSMGDSC